MRLRCDTVGVVRRIVSACNARFATQEHSLIDKNSGPSPEILCQSGKF
jgi:hypothetical protein